MEYNRKVDGYNVAEIEPKNESGNERSEQTKNIVITYYINNEKYADSQVYEGVTEETIQKVKDKLFDYTMYNLNCKYMSSAITFFTIINEVEKIIYNKK